MFQTIGHKSGGFIQCSTFGNNTRIQAWSHGELLGDHYKTVAGASAAITRHHNAWVTERSRDHHKTMQLLFGN